MNVTPIYIYKIRQYLKCIKTDSKRQPQLRRIALKKQQHPHISCNCRYQHSLSQSVMPQLSFCLKFSILIAPPSVRTQMNSHKIVDQNGHRKQYQISGFAHCVKHKTSCQQHHILQFIRSKTIQDKKNRKEIEQKFYTTKCQIITSSFLLYLYILTCRNS